MKKAVSFALTAFLIFLCLVALVHASFSATVSSVHVSVTPDTLQTFQVTVTLNDYLSAVKATIANVEMSGWGSGWVSLNSTLPLNLTTVGGVTQSLLLFHVLVPSGTVNGSYPLQLLVTINSGDSSSTINGFEYLDLSVPSSMSPLELSLILICIGAAILLSVGAYARKWH